MGDVIQLRPYQCWSAEELQGALNDKVERARLIMEQADVLIGELALRGVVINGPEAV